MVRVFVGIDLPPVAKTKLLSLAKKIPLPDDSKLLWVDENNIHITLKFLGEVSDYELNKIIDELKKISFKPFSCRVSGFSSFPSESFIKVLSGNIIIGGDELRKLAGLVDEKVKKFVRPEEREFSTHLTLARVKNPGDKREFVLALKKSLFDIDFNVSEFKLIKSVLTDEGPVYTILYNFPLKSTKIPADF